MKYSSKKLFIIKNIFNNFYKKKVQLKSKEQINYIYKACQLTSCIYEKILQKDLKPGVSEKELASKIYDYSQQYGADKKLAFPTIVGSGPNSSFVHSTPSDRRIAEGDVVQFDFGVKYRGYCSDLSRVVYLCKKNGGFSSKIYERYKLVKKAQKKALNALEARRPFKEIHELVVNYFQKKDLHYYFQHSLGHGVGLDIHEFPSINADANKNLFPTEGMVVTLEPGLYFPKKYGFRIEDTVLVTKFGTINLTKATKEFFVL
jgi:Xaa-Pro aminopeptidase